MARSRLAGWAAAAPLLLLVALAVLLPFAWRNGGLLWHCVSGGECAAKDLFADDYYLQAVLNTIGLSLASTLLALAFGLGAAVAMARLSQQSRWRGVVSALAGLGANFAGVPLAVALTLLLGTQGVLSSGLGFPFALNSGAGLLLAYLCFQLPLATLLLLAPVQMMLAGGLEEAAATLGAQPLLFWRRVGLPLLLPSFIEVGSLLFANAAAAYATPFALAGTDANVLAVRIASLVSGDIFAQPELSALLALVMFVLLVAVIGGGRWLASRLQRRASA